MNILLIGNGFDLAHDLPTTYQDFLKFVEVMKQVLSGETEAGRIDWKDIDFRIEEQIRYILRLGSDEIILQKKKWENL